MLQNIKLDDRTYDEIRDEAVSNIIKHCPEWTNHNSSDPGITLIELFSSMTEMVLYRLNQVPQKNYIAFLDLIGIQQRLPIPSRTNVYFNLSDGYQMGFEKKDTIFLKKDTLVTTEPQVDDDVLVFQTAKDIYLSNIKLLNVYSKKFNLQRNRDDILNHTKDVENVIPFTPFDGAQSGSNQVHIYLESRELQVLQNNVKATLMFRLPTTMREYKISKEFMQTMKWQFFDGFNWLDLNIAPNYKLVIDEQDADVFIVTFEGNNDSFESTILDIFSEDKNYHIRGIFQDIDTWLQNFMIYEISLVSNSDESGVLPDSCYHNYEQLDLNNNFYPFGSRPKIDDPMRDEIFMFRCNESLSKADSVISLEIVHSNNPEYQIAKGSTKLQIMWEYPIGVSKWDLLEVEDTTDNFTKNGDIVFKVPKDIAKVSLNGEDGYWVRAKIVSGDFGYEEKTEYDEQKGSVKVTPATLRPPLLDRMLVHYTLTRKDFTDCIVFNDFKYSKVEFDKNRPVPLFSDKSDKEEALILGFDSYLSDDYLDIYFEIEDSVVENRNIHKRQRMIQWEIYQSNKWIEVEAIDETDSLTKSGSLRIKIPSIDKLELLTVYVDELKRFWLKAKVEFNSLISSPVIKSIKLNNVEVIQQETFRDEYIDRSVGLPNMRFKLNYSNLVSAPIIYVGDEEFKAINRFIDYGQDDKVFRFNGITGEIEFGNGQYGAVPKLGLPIVAKEYSITKGAKGNILKNKLKVIQESINYIDSVTNSLNATGGQNGDTLEDLKRYAPSVLKTMQRAVTIDDYELLSESFSPFIKKTRCIYKDGEVIVVVMTNDVLKTNGFININLLNDLEDFLNERSLITIKPIVVAPKIVNVKIYLQLKKTSMDVHYMENELSSKLLKKAQSYFDPFTGYNGDGYPLGKEISKGDLHSIINMTNSMFYMTDVNFKTIGSNNFISKLNLSYNEIINIEDIILEDISYEI